MSSQAATAQTIVGPAKAEKVEPSAPGLALERLRGGWRAALLDTEAHAPHEAGVDALVRILHESIKHIPAQGREVEGRLALKAAAVRAEARVREVTRGPGGTELDPLTRADEVQRALDELLAALKPHLPPDTSPQPGVEGR